MAKVQIKNEKITPFGGIFQVMELFDRCVGSVIDRELGPRRSTFGYQYGEIVRSLMSVYFCGGDWGEFPAPMMQVKGEHILRYALIPYAPRDKSLAFENAYGFAEDRFSAVQTGKHNGKIIPNQPVLTLEGDFITCTAIKKAEDQDGYILRVCNVSGEDRQFCITTPMGQFQETNLAEKQWGEMVDTTEAIGVKPKKIKTYRFRIEK